jgi:hypothetical protein
MRKVRSELLAPAMGGHDKDAMRSTVSIRWIRAFVVLFGGRRRPGCVEVKMLSASAVHGYDICVGGRFEILSIKRYVLY